MESLPYLHIKSRCWGYKCRPSSLCPSRILDFGTQQAWGWSELSGNSFYGAAITFMSQKTMKRRHRIDANIHVFCTKQSQKHPQPSDCDQENNVPLCTAIALPLSPFLSPSFIFLFHPSLNPIRPGTWAAELCLRRLLLDTHAHNNLHSCLHTLSTLHALPPFNFLLSFVWIKTLKSAYKRWPWDTED